MSSDARQPDVRPRATTRASGSTIVRWWQERRFRKSSTRYGMLLWVLAIAVERQVPLTSALTAFRRDANAAWRRRIDRLAAFLETGVSLPDALDQVPDLLPEESMLSIRVGTENGTLAQVLREEARCQSVINSRIENTMTGMTAYIVTLMLTLLAIISFVVIFLIPKFKHIFEGFGVQLPEFTRSVMEVTDLVEKNLFLVAPLTLGALWWLSVYAFALDDRFRSRFRFYPAGRIPPLLSRMTCRQATAEVLRRLSYVIEEGRPVAGAILTMAKYHGQKQVGMALASVYMDHEHGVSCWESLGKSGLLQDREVKLLSSSEAAGNIAWALRRTADRINDTVDYRCRVIVEYAGPALLLCVGVLVGCFAIGFFLPLVQLVGGLS